MFKFKYLLMVCLALALINAVTAFTTNNWPLFIADLAGACGWASAIFSQETIENLKEMLNV